MEFLTPCDAPPPPPAAACTDADTACAEDGDGGEDESASPPPPAVDPSEGYGGARVRSEWEKAILYDYTPGASGGWAEVDPTPGGCDAPKGNECGPWRQEPISWTQERQDYAVAKRGAEFNLPDDGSWYEEAERSAKGFLDIPGRGRPEMVWYRDSYAAYHPELGRHVCHCMVSGKPGCTFLDPETGTYVRDAATWKGPGGDGSGDYGCITPGDYNGCHQAEVDTPVGVKLLAEVCQDIEATFGPGPVANRIFFNTVQCGHGGVLHRHGHGDKDLSVFDQARFEDGIEVEAVCPGAIGLYDEAGQWQELYGACGLVGPAFELETVYAGGQDPAGVPVGIGVAGDGDGTTGSKLVKPEDFPPF